MARCPEWYPLFVAADRCHCPPWALLEQSIWWRDKALIAAQAEYEAQEFKSKQNGM
jgi:hypothetical protein